MKSALQIKCIIITMREFTVRWLISLFVFIIVILLLSLEECPNNSPPSVFICVQACLIMTVTRDGHIWMKAMMWEEGFIVLDRIEKHIYLLQISWPQVYESVKWGVHMPHRKPTVPSFSEIWQTSGTLRWTKENWLHTHTRAGLTQLMQVISSESMRL